MSFLKGVQNFYTSI